MEDQHWRTCVNSLFLSVFKLFIQSLVNLNIQDQVLYNRPMEKMANKMYIEDNMH